VNHVPVLPGQRPHISAAVKQLRTWVTICALIFATCAAAQMLVYGCVQYTDVRFAKVEQTKVSKPLRVVGVAEDAKTTAGAQSAAPIHEAEPLLNAPRLNGRASSTTVQVRMLSVANTWLERASSLACVIGVISVVCLTIFSMLGVAVAGGGNVPGVERVVTASAWSLVLTILCLPWNAIAPNLGIPGVFVNYEAMTNAADLALINGQPFGSLSSLAQWVMAPLISLFTVLGVCLWFRSGVEKGVIITSPSELDQLVAREAEMIAKRGVASSAPKAVGALHRAIGEEPVTANAVERALQEVARSVDHIGESTITASGPIRKPQARSVVDADFKRPI
jgi:hypothetical protein